MSTRGKTPAAPPVYRPQPAPRVLQLKAGTSRPAHAPVNAYTPKPLAPPAYRPQARPTAVQGKAAVVAPPPIPRPAPAPPIPSQSIIPLKRPGNAPTAAHPASPCLPARPAAAWTSTHAPRVQAAVQAKAASGRPVQVAQRYGVLTPERARTVPPPGGVVQLARTKSKARITTGTDSKAIPSVKKFCSKKTTDGRIVNVRGLVRQGNKKQRVSTTNYSTTHASAPLNKFLKKTGVYSCLTRLEGGHAIADVFGGPTARTNIFPLPHAFNTIAYKKAENLLNKSLSSKKDTVMEVSIEYPTDPFEGFLTPAEKKELAKHVTTAQFNKLADLLKAVPSWMAWEVNGEKGGHEWTEFDDIRKDFWPRGTRPKVVLTPAFIKAVKKL